MEDLRRCWKVPYIVYYCNLFEQKLDLVDLRVDEFEEAIIDDCGMERNLIIIHLLQKLLKPFINKSIDLTNFEQFLLSVLKRYQLDSLFSMPVLSNHAAITTAEIKKEEGVDVDVTNDDDGKKWSNLTMLTKLDIIYNLCELRLQLADTEAKLGDYEPNELRIEPLGVDSLGNKLWYFGDLRLYEEKKLISSKKTKSNTGGGKLNKKSKLNSKNNKKSAKTAKTAAKTTPAVINKTVKQANTPTTILAAPACSESDLNESNTSGLRRSSRRSAGIKQPPIMEVYVKAKKTKIKEELAAVHQEENEQKEDEESAKDQEENESDEEDDEDDDDDDDDEAGENDEVLDVANKTENEPTATTEPTYKSLTVNEPEQYKNELNTWRCVCVTLDDWINLNEKYKSSKKKLDQEISKLIETSYLPEMPALFQKAEKERMHRLLAMAPKRQSQRLQTKQQHVKDTTDDLDGLSDKWPFSGDSDDDLFNSGDDHSINRNKTGSHHLNGYISNSSKEDIVRQREERLKQRLLKRENNHLIDQLKDDVNSQSGETVQSSSSNNNNNNNGTSNSDFNIRNYFLMHKVLGKVLMCKYAWPFKTKVSEEDAPDYDKIIQNPMDLSTIQLKINSKTYKRRNEFLNDLNLIVQNCLTYNGDDSYYGKLALKFDNFCKRWLQIYYPREISTSLEEKNRQLMNFLNPNNNNNNNDALIQCQETEHTTQNNHPTNGNDHLLGDEFNKGVDGLIGSFNFNNSNEYAHYADSIDSSGMLLKSIHKKRKPPNPDKDKYIQEPQYVTKRTSSGRLVKMKIINDYDYTSDQDINSSNNPADPNAKKRKRHHHHHHHHHRHHMDDKEGIQRHHKPTNGSQSPTMSSSNSSCSNSCGQSSTLSSPSSSRLNSPSSSDNDNSDDEDFISGGSRGGRRVANRRLSLSAAKLNGMKRNGPGRPPLNRSLNTNQQQSTNTQRRTIKQLTEAGYLNNNDKIINKNNHSDSDNDLNLENFNKRFNSASGMFSTAITTSTTTTTTTTTSSTGFNKGTVAELTAAADAKNAAAAAAAKLNLSSTASSNESKKTELTFEQYVRKLTGSYSIGAPSPQQQQQQTDSIIKPLIQQPQQSIVKLTSANQLTPRFSLKITPAAPSTTTPSTQTSQTVVSKTPLNIPVINPAIKAVLSKLNTNNNNNSDQNQQNAPSVKIIQVPSSNVNIANSQSIHNNKKYLIINNNLNQNQTALTNNTNSLNTTTKLINISQVQPSSVASSITSNKIIMINKNANTSLLTAIPISNIQVQQQQQQQQQQPTTSTNEHQISTQ